MPEWKVENGMKQKIAYIALMTVVLLGTVLGLFLKQSGARQQAILEQEEQRKDGEGHAGEDSSQKKALEEDAPEENTAAENFEKEEPPKETGKEEPVPAVKAGKKTYDKIISDDKVILYNDTGTVAIGDTAYEIYNYVEGIAEQYAGIINRLAKKAGSYAAVYDIVVPTSAGITLPDNKKKQVNTSDQEQSLNKLRGKMSGRVSFVPLYEKMMEHRTEYIYFRTDHHWTAKGAYYAYQAFCEESGREYHELQEYKKKTAKGFKGTFYRETKNNKNLRKDSVVTYFPVSKKVSMQYTTTDGGKISAPVVDDASKYGESMKYLAFISGDNPLTVIKNKKRKDKSACVVIKESYGNAFVPYLSDHYQTVYVIDYRYWEGKLVDFIKKKKVQDVIFLNNISMTRNAYLVGRMARLVP